MAWTNSDDVANVMTGDDGSGSSTPMDNSLVGFLARLTKKKNPLAGTPLGKVTATSQTSQTRTQTSPDLDDDGSVVMPTAGAGQDSAGPNGPGMSSPHLPAKPKSTPAPLQVAPETPKATSTPIAAPDMSVAPAPLPRDVAQTSTQLPTLAPQGGPNKFIRALSRLAGLSGPTPQPGQPYTGPTTAEEKLARIAQLVGAIGNAAAIAAGTPEEKQLAQQRMMFGPQLDIERQKLGNEAAWRTAMYGVAKQKADTGDVRADAERLKMLGGLHAKGMTVDEQGNVRPLSEDEILSDPTSATNQSLRQAAFESKQAQTALAKAHQDVLMNPNNPTFQQRERQIQAQLAMAQQRLELARSGQDLQQSRFSASQAQEGLKIFQPAMASNERLVNMEKSYRDALGGNQQAMVNLLMNHIGMTLGAQKGARLNQATIREAERSRGLVSGLASKLNYDAEGNLDWSDPLRAGTTLTNAQMLQMVELGRDKFRQDVQSGRQARDYYRQSGVDVGEPAWTIDPDGEMPALPKSLGDLGYERAHNAAPNSFNAGGGSKNKPLTADEARGYLQRAGGDKVKARQLARQDGRTF